MYQTHLQGNKHQNKKKKVSDLCKSQPKVYSTFADELADYIEEQKARGVTHKTIPVLLLEEKQTSDEKYNGLNQEEIIMRNWEETAQSTLNPTQNPQLPPQPWPGTGHPSYLGPPGPFQSSNYTCLPLPLPCSGSTQFSSPPPAKEHYYTSCSSLTSESDDDQHRHREKRRTRMVKRDRAHKFGYEEMDTEGRRRKHQRREKYYDSEGKRREPFLELEEEQRKRLKGQSKGRCKDTESEQEDFRTGRDRSQAEHRMTNGGETPLNTQPEINVAHWESGYKPIKSKCKKEKKKSKEKADTRTEEEKLWDDSILGW
ncbi:zinc finger matrin-type protein 1 [Nematolebias whitei]|uniref:zinc finger matrin-type protein 1 n=1 Tax=Nematolebias whitei TaxID=451745 RepID=UPI001899C93F|nr:zinc finger matrin-type protein 1 [Nematolebias whitei]